MKPRWVNRLHFDQVVVSLAVIRWQRLPIRIQRQRLHLNRTILPRPLPVIHVVGWYS